jgi:plasmid stabilization system protein ParE
VHPVIFTPAARAELIGAHDWYENEATGLDKRFRAAIDAAIEHMSDNPRQFPVVYRSIAAPYSAAFPTRSCLSSRPTKV